MSASSISSNNNLLKSIGLFFAQLTKAHVAADRLDVLDEKEYVEYFQALEKLLANYHTTIWTPAADAALALATCAAPASRWS